VFAKINHYNGKMGPTYRIGDLSHLRKGYYKKKLCNYIVVEWAQPIDCSEITIFKVIQPILFMVSVNSYIRHCTLTL